MSKEQELEKAVEFLGRENYKEAIKLLNRLLKKVPSYQQALFERAIALYSINERAKAIEDLNNLLKYNADYPGARDWFARIVKEDGNSLLAAETKYTELKRYPDGDLGIGVSPQAWADCATYFFNAGLIAKGIEILTEYFTNYVSHVTNYISYETAPMRVFSKLYVEQKNYRKGIEWAEQAMNSKFKVPADYEQYIWTLYYLGKTEEAKKQYQDYINDIHGGFDGFIQIQKLKQTLFC